MYPRPSSEYRAATELSTVGIHPGWWLLIWSSRPAGQYRFHPHPPAPCRRNILGIVRPFHLPVAQIPLLPEIKGLHMLAELGDQIYQADAVDERVPVK